MFLLRKCFAEEKKESKSDESDENKIASSTITDDEEAEKQWGYDLYPERRGEKYQPSWTGIVFFGEGVEHVDKIRCEKNVAACAKTSMTLLSFENCALIFICLQVP